MISETSKPQLNRLKSCAPTDDALEACALKIAQHLERHIVLNRDDSEKANKFACMNKYIQVTYLSGNSTELEGLS